MRFSKKFLTALLPIAATGAIVPVVTSCNKSTAWDFSYGDLVNCYNTKPGEGEGTYHSLSEVQNAVKSHISVDAPQELELGKLPSWGLERNNQLMYFDLIASRSLIDKVAFEITQWDTTSTDGLIIKYKNDGTEVEITASELSYAKKDGETTVYIKMGDNNYFKSYCFQYITLITK